MAIDYEAIRLMHDCHDAVVLDSERQRRLAEIRNCDHRRNRRVVALQRTLARKSKFLNNTEAEVLSNFPYGGINISTAVGCSGYGHISNALIYCDALCYSPIANHKAIVSLIYRDYLGIATGYLGGDRSKPVDVIVKL